MRIPSLKVGGLPSPKNATGLTMAQMKIQDDTQARPENSKIPWIMIFKNKLLIQTSMVHLMLCLVL